MKYHHLGDDLSTFPPKEHKTGRSHCRGWFSSRGAPCHHVICHRVKRGGNEKTRRKSMNIVEIVVLFVSQVCSVRFYWLKKSRVTIVMTYLFPDVSEFNVCLWQNTQLTTETTMSHENLVSVTRHKEHLLRNRKDGLRLRPRSNYFSISGLRPKTKNIFFS